jgi:hypothetical protein
MGRYIQWDDIIQRYPNVAAKGGSNQVGSAYLDYAETELEGRLAGAYTIPFSSNNLTIKDLSIDMVYAKSIMYTDTKKAKVILDYLDKRIGELIDGTATMITTSGDAMFTAGDAPWSTTKDYHNTFGVIPIEDQNIDTDRIEDEYDERDFYDY